MLSPKKKIYIYYVPLKFMNAKDIHEKVLSRSLFTGRKMLIIIFDLICYRAQHTSSLFSPYVSISAVSVTFMNCCRSSRRFCLNKIIGMKWKAKGCVETRWHFFLFWLTNHFYTNKQLVYWLTCRVRVRLNLLFSIIRLYYPLNSCLTVSNIFSGKFLYNK